MLQVSIAQVARSVLLAAFLAACGDGEPDAPWARVEDDAVDGINFRNAWGIGEEVWAIGQPFDLPISVVVHHDGAGWELLTGGDDLPEDSYSLWATSSDEVWLVGDFSFLWH